MRDWKMEHKKMQEWKKRDWNVKENERLSWTVLWYDNDIEFALEKLTDWLSV